MNVNNSQIYGVPKPYIDIMLNNKNSYGKHKKGGVYTLYELLYDIFIITLKEELYKKGYNLESSFYKLSSNDSTLNIISIVSTKTDKHKYDMHFKSVYPINIDHIIKSPVANRNRILRSMAKNNAKRINIDIQKSLVF